MLTKKINQLKRLFKKDFSIDYKRLKKDLEEDFDTYKKIKNIIKPYRINKKEIIIYYPASSFDFSSIVMLIDCLIKDFQKITIITIEIKDIHMFLKKLAEKYFKTKAKKTIQKNNRSYTLLEFKNKDIEIISYINDAIKDKNPKELKNKIDIYFERAFNLFKEDNLSYTKNIASLIKENGFIISDYGFKGIKLHNFKKIKNIPKDFGLYRQLQIYKKF